jgi:hypothetical protein
MELFNYSSDSQSKKSLIWQVWRVIIEFMATLVEFNIGLLDKCGVCLIRNISPQRREDAEKNFFILLAAPQAQLIKKLCTSVVNKFLFLSIIRSSFMNTQLEIHHVCKAKHQKSCTCLLWRS